MKHEDAEKLVIHLLTAELPTEEKNSLQDKVSKNEAASIMFSQMESTISALREWSDSYKNLPEPKLPSRRPLFFVKSLSIASIAAVILVCLFFIFNKSEVNTSVKSHAGIHEDMKREFSWFQHIDTTSQKTEVKGLIYLSPLDKRRTFGSSGHSEVTGHISGNPSSDSENKELPPEITCFIKQFKFTFHIPLELENRYRFVEGNPVSDKELWLIYEKNDEKMVVFLCKSSGEDTDFNSLQINNKIIFAARKSGILIGFENLPRDSAVLEKLVKQFIR
ncbi:MAG: hypothetical protein ABIH42_03980 [Planctomycetota bacterium]